MMEFFSIPGMSTIITLIFNAIMAVAVIALRATWTPRSEHDKLKARVDSVETGLKGLAEKISNMPDQKAVSALTIQLTQLNGRLDVFDAHFEGLRKDLKRLEGQLHLLDTYQREAGKK